MKYYNNKTRQAGMTLIELTVVLLVLIGLAGLMIPYVTGFISKTHDSTGTNNLARLNSNIQRYQGQFMSLPDNMHSLIENSASTTNADDVYDELMNKTMLSAVTYTEDGATTMSSSEIPLMSLSMAGLSSFIDMKDPATNGSKTFDAARDTVSAPGVMSGTGNAIILAKLNKGDATTIEHQLADAFGMRKEEFNATCNDYIVTGIGQENQLVGRTMSDAPIHFAQNGDMGPNNKYNRFVAVFEIDKNNQSAATGGTDTLDALNSTTADCGDTTSMARFVGTAMIMMDGHIRGLAHEMNHTYENLAAN